MKKFLANQMQWSEKVFGLGLRTGGITKHIEKELEEIRSNPTDLAEWVDVIILALDGYWRAGGSPETIETDLRLKQNKNFKRAYPFPISQDEPSEHIRES
jgi:hypothetical protein